MNELAAGVRLSLAPRFHTPLPWAARLHLSSGSERRDGWFLPRADWRPPTAAELELLLAPTGDGVPTDGLVLLGIPEHLRQRWWDEAGQESAAAGAGAQGFVGALREYFDFKAWPLPPDAVGEVLVSEPGLPLTALHRPDAGRVWGGVNLGDEATVLYLVNLTPAHCAAWSEGAGSMDAGGFFERFPTYPLLRLQLPPGEGFRLPDGGMIWSGSSEGKTDLDVVLRIRGGAQ